MAKKSKNGKKLGRKLLREVALSENLNVRLTPHEMSILRDYCWRYNVTASDVMRMCLSVMGVIPFT